MNVDFLTCLIFANKKMQVEKNNKNIFYFGLEKD